MNFETARSIAGLFSAPKTWWSRLMGVHTKKPTLIGPALSVWVCLSAS